VKHLSGAPLKGRLLASPTNIRLGWKGWPGSSTLAYYENSSIIAVKCFIGLAPEGGGEANSTGMPPDQKVNKAE
jgi:hypothetical protein